MKTYDFPGYVEQTPFVYAIRALMSESLLPRVLLLAGVAAWAGAAVAALLTALSFPLFPIWALFSVIFLATFVWNARSTSPSLISIGAQSSSVIVMVATLCNGYEGLLLVARCGRACMANRADGRAVVCRRSVRRPGRRDGVPLVVDSTSAALERALSWFSAVDVRGRSTVR